MDIVKVSHAIIGLGSNLWNRSKNIESALESMKIFSEIIKVSSLIETKFWTPGKSTSSTNSDQQDTQPDYINWVCSIKTNLSANDLLKELNAIEANLWRIRTEKWWSRTIDLDIITFNKGTIKTKTLIIPHKYAKDRDFVMNPIKEIDKEMYKWLLGYK